MSKFLDLLKQIPPGDEEIPEDLYKKLDTAAINLLNNQTVDAPPEGPKSDDYVYEGRTELKYEPTREDHEPSEIDGPIEEYNQPWVLLDRWPLKITDLTVFQTKDPDILEQYEYLQRIDYAHKRLVKVKTASSPLFVIAVSFNHQCYAPIFVGTEDEVSDKWIELAEIGYDFLNEWIGLEAIECKESEIALTKEIMDLRDDYLRKYW